MLLGAYSKEVLAKEPFARLWGKSRDDPPRLSLPLQLLLNDGLVGLSLTRASKSFMGCYVSFPHTLFFLCWKTTTNDSAGVTLGRECGWAHLPSSDGQYGRNKVPHCATAPDARNCPSSGPDSSGVQALPLLLLPQRTLFCLLQVLHCTLDLNIFESLAALSQSTEPQASRPPERVCFSIRDRCNQSIQRQKVATPPFFIACHFNFGFFYLHPPKVSIRLIINGCRCRR